MKQGRLMALVCAVLALSACGVKKDKKDADNMEKEAQAQQRIVLNENLSLIFSGVDMGSTNQPAEVKWEDKSADQINKIEASLLKTKSAAGRMVEIGNHKNMKWKGSQGPAYYQKTVSDANFHLASLKKFKTTPRQQAQPAAPAPAAPLITGPTVPNVQPLAPDEP